MPAAEAEAQRVFPVARAQGIGGKLRIVAGSPRYPSSVGERGEDRKCTSSVNALCTRLTGCCGVFGRGCLLWHGGGVREEDSCPRNGIMGGGVSQGTFWLPLLSFREVSKEYVLMIMGGLVGCPRDIRALLGDRSRVYCWSRVLCIVGDTAGCFGGF